MRWGDEIMLIKHSEPVVNENGFAAPVEPETRTVFCNVRAVGSAEFYAASQAGYKAQLKVEIRAADSIDADEAELNGKRYQVIRTYSTLGENVELTLGAVPDRG